MSLRLLRLLNATEAPKLRRSAIDEPTLRVTGTIVEDVRRRGAAAAREHAERLGDLQSGEPMLIDARAMRAALGSLPPDQRDVLQGCADRIQAFALQQRECLSELSMPVPGGEAGHTIEPIERAGCYAPGGRFPLPSSVLMTAMTARAAGVPFVCVASPRPAPIILAAAAIARADCMLAIGGAQAIAAMAFGIEGLPACDLIVGPGNRWVTAAKHLVSAHVAIDMLAGPSELVVLADDSADPVIVAADLLAQAEHDDDALPLLISTSRALIDEVELELERQLLDLPTQGTALRALRNGFAIVAANVDEAVELCDRLAPEHLQVMMRDAEALAPRLRQAGALFFGPHSAEVLGDYGIGPNHVLPTGGTARATAGLSVLSFLRVRTWLRIDYPAAARAVVADAAALARMEGLEAHARAAEARGVHVLR